MHDFFIAPDSYKYLSVAKNIAAGNGMKNSDGQPHIKVGILYGIFLSLFFKSGISNYSAIIFIQSVILGFLLFWIVIKIYARFYKIKPRDYWILLIIITFYPPIFGASFFLLTEMLFMVLFYSSLHFYFLFTEKKIYTHLIFSAMLAGASALTRSVIFLFPFITASILILYSIFKKQNFIKTVFNSIVFLFFFSLVIMPLSLRNYLVFKKIIPISISGGSIYGGYLAAKFGEENFWGLPQLKEFSKIKNDIERDEKLKILDKQFLNDNFKEFAKYSFIKFFRFFYEIPGSKKLLSNNKLILIVLTLIHFSVLLLSAAGIFLLLLLQKRQNIFLPIIFIGYTAFIHSISFANGRYRLPIEPLLLIFAVISLNYLMDKYNIFNKKT